MSLDYSQKSQPYMDLLPPPNVDCWTREVDYTQDPSGTYSRVDETTSVRGKGLQLNLDMFINIANTAIAASRPLALQISRAGESMSAVRPFLRARIAKRILDSMANDENELVRSDVKFLSSKYEERLSAVEPVFDSLLDNKSYHILEDALMKYHYSQGSRDQTETCSQYIYAALLDPATYSRLTSRAQSLPLRNSVPVEMDATSTAEERKRITMFPNEIVSIPDFIATGDDDEDCGSVKGGNAPSEDTVIRADPDDAQTVISRSQEDLCQPGASISRDQAGSDQRLVPTAGDSRSKAVASGSGTQPTELKRKSTKPKPKPRWRP